MFSLNACASATKRMQAVRSMLTASPFGCQRGAAHALARARGHRHCAAAAEQLVTPRRLMKHAPRATKPALLCVAVPADAKLARRRASTRAQHAVGGRSLMRHHSAQQRLRQRRLTAAAPRGAARVARASACALCCGSRGGEQAAGAQGSACTSQDRGRSGAAASCSPCAVHSASARRCTSACASRAASHTCPVHSLHRLLLARTAGSSVSRAKARPTPPG
jgi:hypothetical protein